MLGGPKLGQEEPPWIEKVFLPLPLLLELLLALVLARWVSPKAPDFGWPEGCVIVRSG